MKHLGGLTRRNETYVLPLNLVGDNVRRRAGEQGRTTALFDGVLHERGRDRNESLADPAIRVHGLLLLVRAHRSRVHCVDPDLLVTDKAQLALVHATDESADEEDHAQFCAVVQIRRPDVLVDLLQALELDAAGRGPVQVGRLQHEPRVGRLL